MKYLSLIIIVASFVAVWYWWFFSDPVISPVEEVVSEPSPVGTNQAVTNESFYENEKWGISFTYPDAWETFENTFRTVTGLFNVAVQPISIDSLPRPLIINLVKNDWGQTLFNRAPNKTGFKEVTVAGYRGVAYESVDMSLPTEVYLFQVTPEYWVMIIGKKGYEDELAEVLGSLDVTPIVLQQ